MPQRLISMFNSRETGIELKALPDTYCIAGNFRMVQNFVVFVNTLATVKIKTMKISMSGESDDVTVNEHCTKLTQCMGERSIQPC